MSDEFLPLLTRLWFAWVAFFRVLFDPTYAARAFELQKEPPQLAGAPGEALAPLVTPSLWRPPALGLQESSPHAALQLLALLQREGRLVDFLEQDLTGFTDADIGAAARVVHEGCRKALHTHVELEPIRDEQEGARVILPPGFEPAEIKLTGNVQGAGPYEGVVRHRGWRASGITLPKAVEGYDPQVIAPAEVEL